MPNDTTSTPRGGLPSSQTALLVIDAQTSLIAEGAWDAEAILARIENLIEQARREGSMVVFVVDRRVEPDAGIHPSLSVGPADPVIEKGFSDSFLSTRLAEVLDDRGVGRLIVAGLQTDYCIDTTCRRAASLGYDVVLVADAHTTFDHEHLEAPEIIAHHNRILRDFPAGEGRIRVVPAAEVNFRDRAPTAGAEPA